MLSQNDPDNSIADSSGVSAPEKTSLDTSVTTTNHKSDDTIDGVSGPDLRAIIIPLNSIKLDPGIQCRAGIDEEEAKEYSRRMRAGEPFPAVVIYQVDGELLLADGFHRHWAARAAGLADIRADVRVGTRADAIRFGIQANVERGLPLTNRDKRHAAKLALEVFTDWSSRKLADLLKVSPPFIESVRRQLPSDGSSLTRVGKDGKGRKLPAKSKRRTDPALQAQARTVLPAPSIEVAEAPPGQDVSQPATSQDAPPKVAEIDIQRSWSGIIDSLRVRQNLTAGQAAKILRLIADDLEANEASN